LSRHVVVIGAGVAGTAAAYAAATAGAKVTLVGARPGATSLASGAIDGATVRPFGEDRARVLSFFEALGLWEIGAERCRVATRAGLLRDARGRDRGVLDLSRIEGGVVAVVDAGRGGFDAEYLARAWSLDPFARERGLAFRPVPVEVLRFADEAWFPDADLAARHDDPDRVRWLADRLRKAPEIEGARAVVMGPWLGLTTNVAEQLSRELGVPMGEPLSHPGGVAGLRFDRARDALLAKCRIEHVRDRARAVCAPDAEARAIVELESDAVHADAIVLAIGGLAGGGIVWAPDESDHGFATSLDGPLSFALKGAPLRASGSPHGPIFEPFAWSGSSAPCGFERAGIWTGADGRARNREGQSLPWLYVAGDAVADAPRTVLEAIRSGISAGTLAASTTGG
jgi:glycerol-3-phosphate dehydrogenase subunit B